MSLLIKGMDMPKEGGWKTIRIYPDGSCAIPNWQGDCTLLKGVQAVKIRPHGRLIDADASIDVAEGQVSPCQTTIAAFLINHVVGPVPRVVIPAEEGET